MLRNQTLFPESISLDLWRIEDLVRLFFSVDHPVRQQVYSHYWLISYFRSWHYSNLDRLHQVSRWSRAASSRCFRRTCPHPSCVSRYFQAVQQSRCLEFMSLLISPWLVHRCVSRTVRWWFHRRSLLSTRPPTMILSNDCDYIRTSSSEYHPRYSLARRWRRVHMCCCLFRCCSGSVLESDDELTLSPHERDDDSSVTWTV